MRARCIQLLAAVLFLVCGIAPHAQSDGSNTAPEHKGNTGWTGGAQDHPSQSDQLGGKTGSSAQNTMQSQQDADSARSQPLTATGVDLNGPPQRFPANKTPE